MSHARDSVLRTAVAAYLTRACAAGGALAVDGANDTFRQFTGDARREEMLGRLTRDYLEATEPADLASEGRCLVTTAGPPGVGKSSYIAGRGDEFATYRHLDADEIKDRLLRLAMSDGTFDHLLATTLPDGRAIAPRELSTLVHRESTRLIDDVKVECMRRGENIILHGTLQWTGLPDVLIRDLVRHDYRSLEVLSFEAPLPIVLERAEERWWTARFAEPVMGGRFTPPDVIRRLYEDGDHQVSRCRANAHRLRDAARPHLQEVEGSDIDHEADSADMGEATG